MSLGPEMVIVAGFIVVWSLALVSRHVSAFSTSYETIQRSSSSSLVGVSGEKCTSPILSKVKGKKSLVVVLPQLGEFDSSEYCEFLVAAEQSLIKNDIEYCVIGIGAFTAARQFCDFTSLPPERLLLDLNGDIHRELGLHAGPGFDIPDSISDNVLKFMLGQLPGGAPKDETQIRVVAKSWLNYLAMCAGIGAPGTLREILRGYFGDMTAPERFRDDDVVDAGFVTIGPGVGPTKIGPLSYQQWFGDERGYQRPVELATIRLKNMVEVLTKWDKYVSNPSAIAIRGATYLFDEDGKELYSYKSKGVLTYSETMPRPLSFLSPYIGKDIAYNPLGLKDNGGGSLVRGRGILKPIGKAMNFISAIFKLENKLQAQLLGADDADYISARKEIEETISSNNIVIYTYGLSPFSSETLAVLDEACVEYKKVEVGLEWFLLDKEKSILRAELLKMTGQSSLPHVFINGKYVSESFYCDFQFPYILIFLSIIIIRIIMIPYSVM